MARKAKKTKQIEAIVMTPDSIPEIHNAIAEAVGEPKLLAPEIASYLASPLSEEVTPEQDAAIRQLHEEIEADNAKADAEATQELSDTADVEEDVAKPNSVVKEKFKIKYLENARAAGIAGKAAKRSNWDWLAREIARLCLNEQHKISIPCFMDILAANGVDYSRWTNRNKGWEGRFRMTGRVALQKVVANRGHLFDKEGTEIHAPVEFIEKYKTKA